MAADEHLLSAPFQCCRHQYFGRLKNRARLDVFIWIVRTTTARAEEQRWYSVDPLHQKGVARIGRDGDASRLAQRRRSAVEEAFRPWMITRQLMAQQRGGDDRSPCDRVFTKEWVGFLKLPQRLTNLADNGINIFMREELEIDPDSASDRNTQGDVRIQPIGFNRQDLYRRGVGDGLVRAAPRFVAPTFYPAVNPPQQPAQRYCWTDDR